MKAKKTEVETKSDRILRENGILFCSKDLPMSETCMCWGLEVGEGWLDAIEEAASKMEALNLLFYPRFKTRIQADQVKEKYGTLRFYYSVVCDDVGLLAGIGTRLAGWAERASRRIDFGTKRVVDREAYVTDETEEVTQEQYEKYKDDKVMPGRYRAEGGKFYRDYQLHHPPAVHVERTKHRMLYRLLDAAQRTGYWLRSAFCREFSPEQHVVMNALSAWTEEIVKKAEKDCYGRCEKCGAQIGTSWSPRCETAGWITYVCPECADKGGSSYYKNGELWQNGKVVMTREQVDAERRRRRGGDGDEDGDEDEGLD